MAAPGPRHAASMQVVLKHSRCCAQGTIMGYPFGVSGLPDTVQARPTAELQQALSNRQGDAALRSSIQSLQVTSVALQRTLHQLVMLLLKPAVRSPMLQFIQ